MTTPEQGDPAEARQWTAERKLGMCTIVGPELSPGQSLVPLERAQQAEEAARGFAEALTRIHARHLFGATELVRIADDALDRHPGFLPNYPGENG